jgi:hexosaminidase
LLFLAVTPLTFAATPAPSLSLMPMPADIQLGKDRLALPSSGVVVALAGPENARLHRGLSRALRRWEERTGATFQRSPDGKFVFATAPDRAVISIEYQQPSSEYPKLGDNESYTLQVGATGARLHASADVGVMRGF